jgi:hypothetical protein
MNPVFVLEPGRIRTRELQVEDDSYLMWIYEQERDLVSPDR